ncbi:MAG TPA: amino acid racemase [Ramlibacter sp.]|nr:amino acid racemase [Ramlibacter sp.]
MPRHIGIVGCSAEGAALCYRTICTEAPALLGPHAHPEVSMHTHSLHLYVEALDAGDLQGVADLMLASAHKLARMGADFLVCPDNTIHQAFALVQPHSPLPWLHIADEVAAEAVRRGFRKLGITGTHWLVGSEVYPERLQAHGLAFARPTEEERQMVGRLIMDELVRGIQTPRQVAALAGAIAGLQAQGCDAVVLGCTELPLVMHDGNSPLPTLDSTRLLARAALRRSVAKAVE